MHIGKDKKDNSAVYINCISGEAMRFVLSAGTVEHTIEHNTKGNTLLFVGPGLIDLQINGVNGIDFNDPMLTEQLVVEGTYFLLKQGVTTFFPTVNTNSDENICKIVATIQRACSSDPLVDGCIGRGSFGRPVSFEGSRCKGRTRRTSYQRARLGII